MTPESVRQQRCATRAGERKGGESETGERPPDEKVRQPVPCLRPVVALGLGEEPERDHADD